MENPGIYIHIPFCLKKCPYCDFYSIVSGPETHRLFLQRLLDEIRNKADDYSKNEFDTVYIGGGTPNCIDSEFIRDIITTVKACFTVKPDAEITIELNPECVTKTDLELYKETGITRLSLGTQSFLQKELMFLGRIHTRKKNIKAIETIRTCDGFTLSCDLIMGMPNQSETDFRLSLEYLDEVHPDHISVYTLTPEEGTPLYSDLQKGSIIPADEETVKQLWLNTHAYLTTTGYDHYEVSNYSLPGYVSRHNYKYWNDTNYLGFGPSAHSKWGRTRFWNPGNLNDYIQKGPKAVFETINKNQGLNEQLMLSLRTRKGFDLKLIDSLRTKKSFMDTIHALNHDSEHILLKIEDGYLKGTPEGWILLDTIIEQLSEKIIW